MKMLSKYISMFAGVFLLAAGILTGCVEDNLETYDPNGGSDELAPDEYGFGFAISLDKLSSTRAFSDLVSNQATEAESYVDTEHLYVLFFNIDGIYLFGIENATAVPIGSDGSGNDRQWFIKIPVKQIHPSLISYIEEHPFKVAVLANWLIDTNEGWEDFTLGDPEMDKDGNLLYDEEGRLKGTHISVLAHAMRDTAYQDDSREGYLHLVDFTINDKPHMAPYTEWVKNFQSSETAAEATLRGKYDVDRHLYTNSNMTSRGPIEYHDMWRLWNFGGETNADVADVNFYNATNSAIRNAWIANNQAAMPEPEEDTDEYWGSADDKYWPLRNHERDLYVHGAAERVVNESDQPVAVKIAPFEGFSEQDNDEGKGFPANNKISYVHFYAKADGYLRVRYKITGNVKMKVHIGLENFPGNDDTQRRNNRESRSEVDNKVNRTQEGEMEVFEAFGDIPNAWKHVFIYCLYDDEKSGEDETPEIPEIPETPEDPDPADPGAGESEGEGEGEGGEEEPAPIILPGIEIYEIEYIESRHLYDVDREGILPTKEKPIPMYGIQDFDPIGEYWQPGLLFNLSMFNNAVKEGYNYRTVSLLRSLARVDVLVSKSGFARQPSHVFLRSMNRSARTMPVDFFTPTDIIWNGYNSSSKSDVARLQHYKDVYNGAEAEILENCRGVDVEVDRIMQFGPIYIGRDASNREPNAGLSDAEKMIEYRQTTAWPFGIWEPQWGWNWNRAGKGEEANASARQLPYFDTYKPGQTRSYHNQVVPDYPHILHTRISRSDYARFHYVGDEGGYYRYVIYVPEKNITDADNPGNIADRPKIIHVELRFNGGLEDNPEDNQVENFDDNGAYRLYFTPGGHSPKYPITDRRDWDSYEYDWDAVSDHWPIMRNHIYKFTVDGGGPNYTDHSITFQVEAPEKRSASWDFY